MTADKVDPAALLIAILALGVGPLSDDGPWDPMNSIISIIVLLIVVPYFLSNEPRQRLRERGPRLPVAVAVGFAVGIGLAWPVQTILAHRSLLSVDTQGIDEKIADAASRWALLLTLVVAAIIWGWLWSGRRRTSAVAQADAAEEEPGPTEAEPAAATL